MRASCFTGFKIDIIIITINIDIDNIFFIDNQVFLPAAWYRTCNIGPIYSSGYGTLPNVNMSDLEQAW